VKFCPFLFEFFEAVEAFLLCVLGADVAESLPEFAGDYDVSLGFAEPSVADAVGFSYLPCVAVDAAGLRFVS
jgi:hypothetical protein